VNEVPSPQLRISDLDREAALRALGEHMSVGRLDIGEYSERSERVTAAKTRGELAEVFADLPQPHPQLDDTAAVATQAGASSVSKTANSVRPMAWADRPLSQRLTAAAIPLAWVAGIALFFGLGGFFWFLLPVAVTAVGRGLWGQEWEHDRLHRDRSEGRQYRDRRHDHRRD
jgi:hypothetical protein